MASAYIDISGTATTHSGELLSFIRQLRQIGEQSAELKSRYDQMAMGGDWTALAGYLDLNEADAQAIYNMLGSVNTELHGTFISQLLARAG
jgi:hypothetical protein